MLSVKLVFIVLAIVCFAIAFINRGPVGVSWRDGGFLFVTCALFVS